MTRALCCALSLALTAACATAPKPAPSPSPSGADPIVDAADRPAADRALDLGRKPRALLDFVGVKPGMKVAELFAGGGYTTELLARAVGDGGTIYGVNNRFVLEKFAEKPWSERLTHLKNVVRVDREFDDPLPPEVKDLDAVVIVLSYHDMVWQNVDRAKMNAKLFAALKPGGVYVIVDHAAAAGHGTADAQTFHRIEEKVVKDEVTAAGFVVDGESDAWKNAADAHDWNDSPRAAGDRRGTSDRFAIRFKKPA